MQYTPYCIEDPNNTLSLYGAGIIDDLDKKKNVSKINLMIKRCSNSSESEHPQCSSPDEIDQWLEGK